jgi:hypothetical protein
MKAYERAHGIAHGFAKLSSASLRIATGTPHVSLRIRRTVSRRHVAAPPAAARKPVVAMPAFVAIAKCSERGCVFPVFKNGRCRAHAFDATAEWSTIPSVSRPIVTGLRGHFA